MKNFVKKWYNREFEELANAFSLFSLTDSGISEDLQNKCPQLSSSRVIGSTEVLNYFINSSNIVSGGPCIDDCHNDISIESVFEIATLIKVGKELKKKVIIHIGVEEEILRTEQSTNSIEKWKSIGARYENIIKNISKRIGYFDVVCLRSDEAKVNSLIEKYAFELQKTFSYEDARTLYQHLSSLTKKPVQKDSFNFNIHTRFLALYLPDFIEEVLNISEAKLLVYEDLQQVMAVKKGNAFSIIRNNFNKGPHQIITLPFPSTDGSTRMHRFDKTKRLFLNSQDSELINLCESMPEDVFYFNQKNWPIELLSSEIKSRTDLANFFISLRECDAS